MFNGEPTMTRKDYVLIADAIAIAQANPCHFFNGGNVDAYTNGAFSVAVAIANRLAADNPAFDRARFLKACGIAK